MVSKDELFANVEKYNHYLTYAGIAIGIACVIYIAYKAFKPAPKSSEKL